MHHRSVLSAVGTVATATRDWARGCARGRAGLEARPQGEAAPAVRAAEAQVRARVCERRARGKSGAPMCLPVCLRSTHACGLWRQRVAPRISICVGLAVQAVREEQRRRRKTAAAAAAAAASATPTIRQRQEPPASATPTIRQQQEPPASATPTIRQRQEPPPPSQQPLPAAEGDQVSRSEQPPATPQSDPAAAESHRPSEPSSTAAQPVSRHMTHSQTHPSL
jgi:hypothetical protein